MRRLLYFVGCATLGTGILILLSGGTGASTGFGIAFCAGLLLTGAVGARWGGGPVARGVPSPELASLGVAVLLLCALGGVMLLWRPALGSPLPMWPFLICVAISGLLMTLVGRMGQEANTPQ